MSKKTLNVSLNDSLIPLAQSLAANASDATDDILSVVEAVNTSRNQQS